MLIELFAFFGILATIMFFFADAKNYGAIRIIASLLLLFMAMWVFNDGISYNDYKTTSISGTSLTTGLDIDRPGAGLETNTTINETTTLTQTQTETLHYSEITWPYETIMKFKYVLFIMLLFSGLYGIFTYRGEAKTKK